MATQTKTTAAKKAKPDNPKIVTVGGKDFKLGPVNIEKSARLTSKVSWVISSIFEAMRQNELWVDNEAWDNGTVVNAAMFDEEGFADAAEKLGVTREMVEAAPNQSIVIPNPPKEEQIAAQFLSLMDLDLFNAALEVAAICMTDGRELAEAYMDGTAEELLRETLLHIRAEGKSEDLFKLITKVITHVVEEQGKLGKDAAEAITTLLLRAMTEPATAEAQNPPTPKAKKTMTASNTEA